MITCSFLNYTYSLFQCLSNILLCLCLSLPVCFACRRTVSGSISGSSYSGSSSKSRSSSASLSRSRSGSHKSRYVMHRDGRVPHKKKNLIIEKVKCKYYGITEFLCRFSGLCRSVACHLSPPPPPAVARSGVLTQMICTLTWLALYPLPAPDHPLQAMLVRKGALHGTGARTKREVLWLSDYDINEHLSHFFKVRLQQAINKLKKNFL